MEENFKAFRLYADQRSRTKVRLASALFIFGGLGLKALDEPVGISGLSVVIGVTLAFISELITLPDQECAFCRRSRRAVQLMVAGPSVSICDECAALSMQTFFEENDRKADTSWIERMVLALPRRTPRAISTPLFRAVVAKDEGHRQSLLWKAFDIGNPEAVSELIMRVPEAERTPSDWVNLGVALENQGRFAEALVALTQVEAQADQEPWVLNNRGTARVELEPCDEQVLRQLLADNQRACHLITERKPEGFEKAAAAMWGAGAELHRRLGEREETLKCLSKADSLSGPHPCRLLTHAELVLGQGRPEEARALLIQTLDLAHPESREASKARGLLSDLPA